MTVLRAGSATDVGRVRGSNQDVFLVTPDLFAVADGMGGHAGGEVAAQDAVEGLRRSFLADPTLEGLRRAVALANLEVWRHSQESNELRGMGTTLTALAFVHDETGQELLALANVGDSRAYVFSDGQLTQVTADHSLAEEKVRHGEMTEAEAAVHPHRHILTRALGISPDVEVDVWALRLQPGNRVLLCSDGLSNEVSDEEMGRVLAQIADPQQAAGALVDRANEHGGSDNITVVVVDVMAADDEGSALRGAAAGTGEAGGAGAAAGAAAGGGAAAATGALSAAPVPGSGNGAAGQPRAAGRAGGTSTVLDTRPEATPGPRAGTGASEDLAGTTGAAPEGLVGGGAGAAPEGVTGAVPTVAGARPPDSDQPAEKLSRRQRNRRAGIPPRVTFRVVLFVLLLAVVVGAGYAFVRWYATDNWYVTLKGDELVIYQGRPGGLLWFQPKLVDRTGFTTSDVLSIRLPALRGDVEEPSLKAAKSYVNDLFDEYLSQQQLNRSSNAAPPATTTPTTAAPATTAPPTATTGVP